MSYNPYLTYAENELLRTKEALRQQQDRIQQESRYMTEQFVPKKPAPKYYGDMED